MKLGGTMKTIKKIHLLSIFLVASILLTSIASADVPAESTLYYEGAQFSYFSNKNLETADEAITRLIIVVHGSARNADTYYKSIDRGAARTGNSESTIIISPHFKDLSDELLPDELGFSYYGWWHGDGAATHSNISSFDLIDHFVELVAERFVNLKMVTITGHSAGGQLTQRYAIGSIVDKNYPEINFRYIVANPGAYAYLTPLRPTLDGSGTFYTPDSSTCAYDDYKYGLQNLNSYMDHLERNQLVENYVQRQVIYLLGEEDVLTNIDQSCAARFQGINRLERGKYFKAHVDYSFPKNNHTLQIVPGVAHTQWGIYTSEMGQEILFQN